MLFCHLSFFKINYNSFRNTIRVSNSLDPDQARHLKKNLSGIPSVSNSLHPDQARHFFQKNSFRDTWSIRVSNSWDPDQAQHYFQKNYFRNTIRVSNSLDPDQAWHFFQKDFFRNTIRVSNSLDPDQARHFFFQKDLSGISSECQTVWIQIRPDIFFKNLSAIPSECQTVWIQIRPNIFFQKKSLRNTIRVSNSFLIWIHTVCKSYQQTTQAGKGLRNEIKDEGLCQQN